MKGRGGVVLYLDYDGVLHHANCLWHPKRGAYLVAPPGHTLFQHADLLAAELAPYPELQIVLSTSWVVRYGVSASAKRLPPMLRERVIGATYHSKMPKDEFWAIPRGQQVSADVARRQSRDWIALDDNVEGWTAESDGHFIQTHEHDGFGDSGVLLRLRSRLAQMPMACTPIAHVPSESAAGVTPQVTASRPAPSVLKVALARGAAQGNDAEGSQP
jgi:hypothetical protein